MRIPQGWPQAFEFGCQSAACSPPNNKGTGGTGGSIKGQTGPQGVKVKGRPIYRVYGDMINNKPPVNNLAALVEWLDKSHPKEAGLGVHWTKNRKFAESYTNPGNFLVVLTADDPGKDARDAVQQGRSYEEEVTLKPNHTMRVTGAKYWSKETGWVNVPGDPIVSGQTKGQKREAAGLKIAQQMSPRIVKTKSIPNVSDERLLDSLRKTHEAIHVKDAIYAWSQTRRSMIEMGRRGIKIRDELTKRGIRTGIDCRFCGNQPGLDKANHTH